MTDEQSPDHQPQQKQSQQTGTGDISHSQVSILQVGRDYINKAPRFWTAFVTVVIALLVVIITLLLIPEAQRTDILEGIGVVQPSPTPTATYTSSPLPTATATPTVTPTPIEGTPFTNDQFGIVLADFTRNNEDVTAVEPDLEAEFNDADLAVIRVHHTLNSQEDAQRIAELYNATIVIWGQISRGGVRVRIEIAPHRGRVNTTIAQFNVAGDEVESLDTYIARGMDVLYVVEFVEGQILYFEENDTAALEQFSSALDRIPPGREEAFRELEVHKLHVYRGLIYRAQEAFDDALAAFDEAIAIDPDYASAYNNRGLIYYQQSDLRDARDNFQQAIELDPTLQQAYNNLGIVQYQLQNYVEASETLTRAIDLAGNNDDTTPDDLARAHFNRALAFAEQDNYSDALADLETALTNSESADEIAYMHAWRGIIYNRQGEYDTALSAYNEALDARPGYIQVYNWIGDTYRDSGDCEQAAVSYQQFISETDDQTLAAEARGNIREIELGIVDSCD